jgi:aminobenzoyl-glutamate transport protein
VAEEAGLVRALIHKLVIVSPAWALTYIMVFVGICSSIAADAGYLVLIPLAAAVFISVGRHPLAGLAASFAGVASVFAVNVLIKPLDGILVGITNDAIHLISPAISIGLASNLWFSIASVLLLTVVIALITEKMIEPRLGAYIGERPVEEGSGMSPEESRGLRYATYGLVGVIVFFALLTLPPGAPLRNPETGAIIGNSPLMNGLIVAITVLFLVMGMAYDIGAETMKNSADVIGAMTKAVGSLSGLIFLLLIISQFLAYFNYSNMATIAAVKMAPVALAIADDLQASPYPFAMIVALAASTAFMTPISSPVNMLVVAPGNYTFGDFVRIGVPFAVIVMVVSVILVPWLLPLY